MKQFGLIFALAAAGMMWIAGMRAHADTIPGGRYGEVHIIRPHGRLRGFLILFSPLSGWSKVDQETADALADRKVLVVGVDSGQYMATLAATQEACHLLVGDAEAISHQLQRELGTSNYFTPIMAGTQEGGILAEQVLSIAASNTIAGAISIDPAPVLDARFKPCPPDPTIVHDPGLPGFWGIGSTTALEPPIQSMVMRLQREGATQLDTRVFATGTSVADMVLALSRPHLGPRAPDEEDVSDLPLIELPATQPHNMLAIMISGDGGWRDLDKTIARDLQARGISVVGIDSLRYFWSKKSPAQTAHDLARVIRSYAIHWRSRSVALIGYSFGADVLPFAYNRLPESVRNKVTLMSLLGFATSADFEIHVTGWLGMPPTSAALPVLPEISQVPPALVQCFYGANENDTICPQLTKLHMTVVRLGGGHHFGGEYEQVAHVILDGWLRRLTSG
jgi:type IV secretory pathway VirJ component